ELPAWGGALDGQLRVQQRGPSRLESILADALAERARLAQGRTCTPVRSQDSPVSERSLGCAKRVHFAGIGSFSREPRAILRSTGAPSAARKGENGRAKAVGGPAPRDAHVHELRLVF